MADSIILTRLSKGQIYPSTTKPKGDIDELEFSKGQLEELTVEYDLTNPNYSVHREEGNPHARTFIVKCVVDDTKRGNLFITISEREKKVELTEHEAVRRMTKELENIYFFSKEVNLENGIEDIFLMRS